MLKRGQIVHRDINIEHYFLTHDASVKLNGLNNAEISGWDEKEEKYNTFSGLHGKIMDGKSFRTSTHGTERETILNERW